MIRRILGIIRAIRSELNYAAQVADLEEKLTKSESAYFRTVEKNLDLELDNSRLIRISASLAAQNESYKSVCESYRGTIEYLNSENESLKAEKTKLNYSWRISYLRMRDESKTLRQELDQVKNEKYQLELAVDYAKSRIRILEEDLKLCGERRDWYKGLYTELSTRYSHTALVNRF